MKRSNGIRGWVGAGLFMAGVFLLLLAVVYPLSIAQDRASLMIGALYGGGLVSLCWWADKKGRESRWAETDERNRRFREEYESGLR